MPSLDQAIERERAGQDPQHRRDVGEAGGCISPQTGLADARAAQRQCKLGIDATVARRG
jgi:hypothetical protein